MNRTEETVLMILKGALHPQDQRSEPGDTDWVAVLEEARKQDLFPLVYDAATAYPSFDGFDEEHPQCLMEVTASVTAQMRQTDAFLALYQAFLAAGLAPITVKGMICRKLYGEKADFRLSGDEDVLIEKKDYETAVKVLTSCDYQMEKQPDRKMDVIQEVTFYNDELIVELHLNPFGKITSTKEKMNDWFRDVFRSEEQVVVNGVPVRTMHPTDHFLFLVFHAFKHFIGCGFGVRMMLDILLFAEQYGERIDWDYVESGLKDVGACGFLADLVEIGNRYLGFYLTYGNPVCPEELLADMFRMGTFGNSTRADQTAGQFISITSQRGKSGKNRLAAYFRLLFPSWRTWTSRKPYLKDKPWMVVGEWISRTGRYLRGETASHNLRELDASYKIAEERIRLLGKYGAL